MRAAHTIAELTAIIDGGAYIFERYGFVAAAFQDYVGEAGAGAVRIELSVFNQGTSENAAALYADPDSGMGEPLPDWEGPGNARQRISFGYVHLQFCEECFFVQLIANAGGADSAPHVRCLAETAADLIHVATPARPVSWGDLKRSFSASAAPNTPPGGPGEGAH